MGKRFLSALLTACMAAGLLAGCGSTAGEVQETAETAAVEELDGGSGPEVDLGPLLDEAVPLAGAPALSTVLTPVASGTKTEKNQSAVIDYSNAADGYVMVAWLAGGPPS